MSLPTSHNVSSSAYTEVTDDVTALTIVQVPPTGVNAALPDVQGVELIVNDAVPAPGAKGIVLLSGDAMVSSLLAALGNSGALYAKAIGVNTPLLTLP